MVSRITIFEPHFEGVQFGPASIGNDVTDDQETATIDDSRETITADDRTTITDDDRKTASIAEDPTGGPAGTARAYWLLAVLSFVLLLGVVAVRRVRNSEQTNVDIDVEDEAVDEVQAR